ncbi:hypothetical protein LIER_06315 [Lithospermum erythrorhizon]|uniref:Uncharacterized protein n=1 Tax=Lithospermum erythrorhizon TaxID=34254 RepID=A0AAV3P6J0_LITER
MPGIDPAVADAIAYMKRCDACQRIGNAPQLPTSSLTLVVSPISFAMWGIGLVGKLPKDKGGVEFTIVAVYYFSKWVEAAPLKKTRSEEEGPYRMKKVVGPSTYELEDLDGKSVPRTWHPSKLCKYYV